MFFRMRKKVIASLLMLSLVLTGGTFAYWASYVEGTSETATGTLTVGYANGVETEFLIKDSLVSGGYLVPTGQTINSELGSVEEINLAYDIRWKEETDTTQVEGTNTSGKISISHSLKIKVNGSELDSNKYPEIFDLINVSYNTSNVTEMTLNGDTETFAFLVTLEEPSNQVEYNLIEGAEISIIFNYRIYDNFITTIDGEIVDQETEAAHFDIIGDETVYVEVTEDYNESGFIAYDSRGTIIDDTWISGGVNNWKLGTYTLTYGAYSSYDNQVITTTRTVIVVDTIAPSITINGDQVTTVNLGSSYSDWGAWVVDNSAESVTVSTTGVSSVDTNTIGEYYISYSSTDSSGNISTMVRTVIVK